MILFKPKVLLRPFKDKIAKQFYGKNETYTTSYKNTVKLLKGDLADTCLQSKWRINLTLSTHPIYCKPSRGVDTKAIKFFAYHDNLICFAHLRGENSGYNKVNVENE